MRNSKIHILVCTLFSLTILLLVNLQINAQIIQKNEQIEEKIDALLKKMSLTEKIGQMNQLSTGVGFSDEELEQALRDGKVGSILNVVGAKEVNKLQKIAVEESPNGIPLLIARDVIHGYKTIFPIPLGQAATWNRELVEKGARIAAIEAASEGIRWTFAPMVDVSRDPRWGRIAESFGEDEFLSSELGAAMVKGFQGKDLTSPSSIAACAKHFVGYGAAEGGRDYSHTSLTENELRNIYLPPFKACVDAGALTIMTAFNENDGIPVAGNKYLLQDVLRNEWSFNGLVVSDWASVTQMTNHGYTRDDKHAAEISFNAGVDMEMVTMAYERFAEELLNEGKINMKQIDAQVKNILRAKFSLGLFENSFTDVSKFPQMANQAHLEAAKKTALQSIVMLQNKNNILPLKKDINSIAVIGPLADQPYEQLGTWIFDGDEKLTKTVYAAFNESLGKDKVYFASGLDYSRDKNTKGFAKAVEIAKKAEAVILCVGEESILSGEAHCRAYLNLPGAQAQLIDEINKTQKPIILVVMAGRPLVIGDLLDKVDAVLYAWHPGTMGGPAIANLVFGNEIPSGKLPVTFVKAVGQIPFYHSMINPGRPVNPATWKHIDDIPVKTLQTSLGNEAHYLDVGYTPLFPFGYGLSYTTFKYENLKLSSDKIKVGEKVEVSIDITNTGKFDAEEIVQLYIRDLVGSYARPIKQLKDFKRVMIKAGQTKNIIFTLKSEQLAFYTPNNKFETEPGKFHVWVGGSSSTDLKAEFELE